MHTKIARIIEHLSSDRPYETYAELGMRFDCSDGLISRAKKIMREDIPYNTHMRIMDARERDEVYAFRREGWLQIRGNIKAVALAYGVSDTLIWRMAHGIVDKGR